MAHVQDDKCKWVQALNGDAPPGTVIGGQDINGEPIYVARVSHNDDLIPGKLVPSQHCMYVSWGGLEFKKNYYEVLVNCPSKWIATYEDKIPANAIPGGKTKSGETLYIGRLRHKGNYTLGKVQKSHKVCYIPFDGKELHFSEYEILTH